MGFVRHDIAAYSMEKYSDVNAFLRNSVGTVSYHDLYRLSFMCLIFNDVFFRIQYGAKLWIRNIDDRTSDLYETGFAILD